MATPTYTLLDSVTLASSAASVTFSSITQDYRDLVLVITPTSNSVSNVYLKFNNDSGSNYSRVFMSGNGSSASSNSGTTTYVRAAYDVNDGTGITQIMDYSATDKHKTSLTRFNSAAYLTAAEVNRWANTAAITSIEIYNATFASGSTFYLYGIEA